MTIGRPGAEDAADLVNGEIARRIAQLRKGRRQSFDELAIRSGVSKGMLVQIEQGRANPSIATLCRLAGGLGVSVVDLIAPGDAIASPVQVLAPDRARVLWHGPRGGSAVLRVGSNGPDMLELWDWTLHPGERFESRAHSAGTQELVHVRVGTLALEVDGLVHALGTGASAFARTDRPHAYACGGRRKTQFSMVVLEPGSPHSTASIRPGGEPA